MSQPLRPGDLVVCVDDTPQPGNHHWGDKGHPVAGGIYTVQSVAPCTFPMLGIEMVRLEELPSDWFAWRFRKDAPPRSQAITDLIRKHTPAGAREDA
jgi:hypothetical protein